MSSSTDFFEETGRLVEEPSTGGFETEIHHVLAGTREHALVQIGGAEEYFGSLLARTLNPAIARREFDAALDRIIQRWNPASPAREHTMAHALELITAFTPDHGFEKVLGHLRRSPRFDATVVGPRDPRAYGDLHRRALVALGSYLDAPPLSPVRMAAFETYVGLLRDHLRIEPYAGYAAKRLYELHQLSVDRATLDPVLNVTLTVIGPLLHAILAPVRRYGPKVDQDRVRTELSSLYQSCEQMTGAEAVHQFRLAVNRMEGFEMQGQGDGLAVRFRGGRGVPEVSLTIEPSDGLAWAQRSRDSLIDAWERLGDEDFDETLRALGRENPH